MGGIMKGKTCPECGTILIETVATDENGKMQDGYICPNGCTLIYED